MLKRIKNNSIITTPFVAVKQWALHNTISDDLILTSDEEPVAYDHIDYSISTSNLWTELWENSTSTFWENLTTVFWGIDNVNSSCNIAINYNTNNDTYVEEGISGSGFFYPNTEPQNKTGTYKRLVYTQTAQAFYNTYHNPVQIFGMDNIDFPLSRTNRNLGNQFLLFSISKNVMGDRLVRGSIRMYDLFLDDNAVIVDDGFGNLLIGKNLFSKIQEVRSIQNIILDGTADTNC